MNQPHKNDNNYDILWKMRTIFDQLNDACIKFCSPSEHLAVGEVIVLFDELFSRNMFIRNKHFGIKIYRLWDMTGYMYNMRIYLGREAKCSTDDGYTCDSEKSD
jgi:hypothetical protein